MNVDVQEVQVQVSKEVKNGHILPTGQWYAPSAVINDTWYCMELHGMAWYGMVLHGMVWWLR